MKAIIGIKRADGKILGAMQLKIDEELSKSNLRKYFATVENALRLVNFGEWNLMSTEKTKNTTDRLCDIIEIPRKTFVKMCGMYLYAGGREDAVRPVLYDDFEAVTNVYDVEKTEEHDGFKICNIYLFNPLKCKWVKNKDVSYDKGKLLVKLWDNADFDDDELDFFLQLADLGFTLDDIKEILPEKYEYAKEFMSEHGLL